MKKLIPLVLLIAALPLSAQQGPAEPSPEQLKALVTILRQQRDQAAQALQDTQAQLQLVAAELDAAKKQLAEAAKAKAPAQPSKP